MSEAITTKNVSKFDGHDYQGWKFQMRALFLAHRIWGIVNGAKVRPAGETPEAEAWDVENARAMFLLSSTLELEQMRLLLICETACEMWTKLASIHEQKSATNKLMLSTKLYEYKMDGNDSITQHVAKVNNMAAQLNDIGEKVSDVTIMAKILGSLTPKYSNFLTAWDNMPPEMQTRENLEERLRREESRLSANDNSESAFVAVRFERKGKGQGQKKSEFKAGHEKQEKGCEAQSAVLQVSRTRPLRVIL